MKKKTKIGLFLGLIVAAIAGIVGVKKVNNDKPKVDTVINKPIDSTQPIPVDTTKYLDTVFNGGSKPIKFSLASVVNEALLMADGSDNTERLNSLIRKSEQLSTIYLPSGNFYFDSTIRIESKSLFIIGTGNTNLWFKEGITGIFIWQNSGYMAGRIEGVNLFSKGESGLYSTNKKGHAIEVHALYDLKNIHIKNFGECGVFTQGGVENNTNASFNHYESVFVREVGSHGFYFQGGDANQTLVERCGIWDVGGWGFYDHSFLGNQFNACMAHASKLGNYRADDANNRATFTGCYSEGGSPADYYGGACRVYGGIHGADGDNWKTYNWAKVDAD